MDKTNTNNLAMPIAIIFAGALIAVAVLYTGNSRNAQIVAAIPQDPQAAAAELAQAALDELAPITKDDHIRGSANAAVTVVEYSDFECPFCKRFHDTMSQVMAEYGTNGDVAWVFRQFPLDTLHPVKARKEALATECAADLGGNDAFWEYTDRLFELSLTNNRTDVDTILPQIANELGLDTAAFQECLDGEKFAQKVSDMVTNAAQTGGRGTPWSIVVAKDGTKYPINGAQPYASVKQIIELALSR